MHLAIVSPYPPAITGIGQYGYYVSRALARSGAFDRITLFTGRAAEPNAVEVPPGVTMERLWQPGRIDAGMQIVTRLYQVRPDLVWFNMGATVFGPSAPANIAGLLSPALARRMGLPSVLTMHEMAELADLRLIKAPGGPLRHLGARWVTWALTQADVVCLTLKHYVERLSRRWPEKRFVHIPIGMYNDPQVLDEPATPELLFFTTLAPFKGLALLLDAFRLLRARIPHVRLTIAGAEHPRFPGYLASMQASYSELDGIRWMGYVPEPNVRDVFHQSQVVVLPYAAATGSSSVLYQAMVWGRPVVTSNLPELRSAVDEAGLRAEFFRNGDVMDLVEALERLLRSPQRRKEQVAWNTQAMHRRCLDETCQAYLHAFNLALKTRSAPAHIMLPSDITAESV